MHLNLDSKDSFDFADFPSKFSKLKELVSFVKIIISTNAQPRYCSFQQLKKSNRFSQQKKHRNRRRSHG